MKKYILILSVLFCGGYTTLSAQANSSPVSTSKTKKALQLREYKNSISFGGGAGLSPTTINNDILLASVFNVSYQRDLIKRLSIELQFENFHTNSFPDFATHEYAYNGEPTDAVKNYILTELDANTALNWAWVRSNTASLGMNMLFHMIEKKHCRFSVYAGIGVVNMSGVEYSLRSWSYNIETLKITSFKDDTRQFNVNYWFSDCGLRCSYIFMDRFALGIDLGYFRMSYLKKMVDSDTYLKTNLFFGIRL